MQFKLKLVWIVISIVIFGIFVGFSDFLKEDVNIKTSVNPQHLPLVHTYHDPSQDFSIKYPESWIATEIEHGNYQGHLGLGVSPDKEEEHSSQIPWINVVKSNLNGYEFIQNRKHNCSQIGYDVSCHVGGTLSQAVTINDKPVTIHQLFYSHWSFGDGSTIGRQVIIDFKTENSTWKISGEYYFPEYSDEKVHVESFTNLKNIINSFKINDYEYDWYSEINSEPNIILIVNNENRLSKTDDLEVSITNNLNKSIYSIDGILNVDFDKHQKEKTGTQCFIHTIDELKAHQTKQLVWDIDEDCSLGTGWYGLTLQVDYIDNKKSSIPMQEFMSLEYFEPDSPYNQLENQLQNHNSHFRVICKNNLELFFKDNYDRTPVCVKPSTITKLVERGWGVKNHIDYHPNKIIKVYDSQNDIKYRKIKYSITHYFEIEKITITQNNSLKFEITKQFSPPPNTQSTLIVELPRKELINNKSDYCPSRIDSLPDEDLIVLENGVETISKEASNTEPNTPTTRTLYISFSENVSTIEILGVCQF